jgi:hypothetical protein
MGFIIRREKKLCSDSGERLVKDLEPLNLIESCYQQIIASLNALLQHDRFTGKETNRNFELNNQSIQIY